MSAEGKFSQALAHLQSFVGLTPVFEGRHALLLQALPRKCGAAAARP